MMAIGLGSCFRWNMGISASGLIALQIMARKITQQQTYFLLGTRHRGLATISSGFVCFGKSLYLFHPDVSPQISSELVEEFARGLSV